MPTRAGALCSITGTGAAYDTRSKQVDQERELQQQTTKNVVCAWNVCFVFCVVVWCALSSCVGVGAGVLSAFVARVCGVARLGTRGKNVYVQDASVCTVKTPARVQNAGVLPVHTETF